MAYNGAGSLFALGMRLTRLSPTGAPLVGPENSYRTDALIQAELGLEYEDGEEIIQKNGAGLVCLTYKAPDSLKRGTISALQLCTPDPNVLAFVTGGTVIENVAGAQIGYQAPEVGTDPNPNGISIELWTRAIIDGAYAGYFRWVVPRAFLRPAGSWTLSGADPLVPEFEGFCTQNVAWGDGPRNDFLFPSERVWQFVQESSVPVLTPGFVPVLGELTTTSVAALPASAPLDLSNGDTVQATAAATMSDLSVRDVTQTALWVSSAPAVATVTEDGFISPVSVGTSNVTATYGGQVSNNVAVTVTA